MTHEAVSAIIGQGRVESFFQPIVRLPDGDVVAHEALARGPEGPYRSPAVLFDQARRWGLLEELDRACRLAAVRGAVENQLVAPLMVFVNVEPEVIDTAPTEDLRRIAGEGDGRLRIVFEFTERALADRPAEMLRTVERVREMGWAVALDDVGAETASLAFMGLLQPEVVKLDLSLVQARPDASTAEVMNAVNAYAERSGALILAEGIETERHLRNALALGATLGQGWLFGRPTGTPVVTDPAEPLVLRPPERSARPDLPGSPFAALPPGTDLRVSPKRLLLEVSKQLEREAMRLGETCVVAATFQHDHHFTASTARRYQDLVDCTGFVLAVGEGLDHEPLPGLRGAVLGPEDPVRDEWDVVVLSPHFSAALLSRDLHAPAPEMDREFEYALTYDRDVVTRAAHELMLRVAPRLPALHHPELLGGTGAGAGLVPDTPRRVPGVASTRVLPGEWRRSDRDEELVAAMGQVADPELLHRALSAITNGLTIVDVQADDQPLVYVNPAFERLAGYDASELLGRNCRFLQGPGTDQGSILRIREAIATGAAVKETLLNFRGPQRTPWWNEVHLYPVTEPGSSRVRQYIGVQADVTDQLRTVRALEHEGKRARSYLAQVEDLASTDPLTGLWNRRRLESAVESELRGARGTDTALAMLFMDLDGFKAINDRYGHLAGDAMLNAVAGRLRTRVRESDLLARFGGDEFLVVLTGLSPGSARGEAERVARALRAAIGEPITVAGSTVSVTASVGVALFPADADDFGPLLHVADLRMYAAKHPRQAQRSTVTRDTADADSS